MGDSDAVSSSSVTDDFPISALPKVVRQMVEEVADVARVPTALPACEALAIISAALGRGLAIPSNVEAETYANIYVIVAAPSGSGKSLTYKMLMAPVYRYQAEQRVISEGRHGQLKVELFRLNGRLKAEHKEPLTDDELSSLIKRKEEIQLKIAQLPQFVCEDVTPPKLAVLLFQNEERMFSASADARQVVRAVCNDNNDNPYIKGWSGDPVQVDRISRKPLFLRAPRISLLWCPQPDLMLKMFGKRVLTDNGFLPRVLPALIKHAPAPVDLKTRRVSEQAEHGWRDLIQNLFETYHRLSGPLILHRSVAVQPVLIEYSNNVVKWLKSELSHVAAYPIRWAEYAWKLTAVLHAAEYGRYAHCDCNEVTSITAENAIRLMEWFSRQQIDLLARTRARARTEVDQAILNTLVEKKEITVRELQLGCLRSHTAPDIRDTLERLVRAGELDCRTEPPPDRGGHGVKYYFNPCNGRDTRDSRGG